MNYKDEINHLNSRITSLKFQLKQMNDFKEENISIKEGLKSLREQIEKINEEKQIIKNNVNPVFNTFKKLISFNQSKYSAINASYDRDILSRMEKDNNYFSNNRSKLLKEREGRNLFGITFDSLPVYESIEDDVSNARLK